ncbi:MAG: lipopolysaccharide heptosyltransferase [Pseudomonadota bacterium]|jgi:heptosyltransferase-1
MVTPGAAPRSILLVKLSSLGDVIHAMPVVADILAAQPGALVDWVVEPGFAPLLRRVQGLGTVFECAQRRWRKRWWAAEVRAEKRAFRAALQAQAYDAVLDLQGLTKSALVARQALKTVGGEHIAMGNRTLGSSWEAPTRWLADRAVALEPELHVVDRGRLFAGRALGYDAQGAPRYGLARPRLSGAWSGAAGVAGDARRNAASAPRPLMVCIHGTSRADKLWPEAQWISLGQRLISAGWRLALPQADSAEAARAQRLVQAWGSQHAEVWPRMALDALADHMAPAQAAIGVDSGLSHLAVALDLAHVQLYNFPTAWRTGPQARHSPAGQAAHLVSVVGQPVPTLEAVWSAWRSVAAARGLPT